MADTNTWTPISAPTDFRDDAVFDIDFKTKTVQVLVEQPIVAGENLSQFIKFQAPRFYDNIDLTEMMVNILYVSPAGNKGISAAVNTEYSDDMIRCGWLVPYAACPQKGTLHFVLEFVGADYTLKTTIASTPVLDSINDEDVVPEPAEQAWYITLQANVSATLQAAQTALGRIESIFNALSTPTAASEASEMLDESTIYVYTGSETGYTYGDWYYYDGTEWVSGGEYASTALTVETAPTQGSTNAVSSGGVYSVTSALDADVTKIHGDIYRVESFKWSNIASSASNYGFRKGYYSKTDGTYTSSSNFICSNGEISLVGVKRVVLIPPSGMCISAGAFKADNTFTIFGEANSKYYTEYIDKPLVFDANDYIRCFVSVGNYENKTPTATDAIADSTYINSIKMYLYFDKYVDDVTIINRELGLLSDSKTIENLFKQGGYARTGSELGKSSAHYPANIVTTNYLPDNLVAVKTSGDYYMTLMAWNSSDGTWVGFLCDENRLTNNRYATIYWTQNLQIEKIRELYPDIKFRIEIEKSETIAGTLTDITPLEAVNAVACVIRQDIQDHYKTEMATTIASVRNAITEPALVFPMVTDIHYESVNHFFDDCIDNIKKLSESIKCDFVLNDGDNTDGNTSPEVTLSRDFYMLARFNEIGIPYYQAVGNHDINGYSSTTRLTSDQIYKAYLSNVRGVHFNMMAGEKDYYVDFDGVGIRLIVLDSNHNATYTFSENAGAWLANTALDTNKIVIVATHMSPINNHNYSNRHMTNSESIISAMQAFVDGGGTIIQLGGHSHADYHFETPWLSIHSCCQKFIQEDSSDTNYNWIKERVNDLTFPERTLGTYTEDCWDVVVVKPISRTINLIRFGAGNDRTFTF